MDGVQGCSVRSGSEHAVLHGKGLLYRGSRMTRPFVVRFGRFGLPAFIAVLAALPYLSRFVSINVVGQAYAESAEDNFAAARPPSVDDTLEISGLQAHFQSIA